jgi:hypothetical protein
MMLEGALPYSQVPATCPYPELKSLFHHGMARPQFADGGTASNLEVAANILNKQSRTAEKGGPAARGLGEVLTNMKTYHVTSRSQILRPWADLWHDTVTHGRHVLCRVMLPVCSLLDAESRKCGTSVLVLKLVSEQDILFH